MKLLRDLLHPHDTPVASNNVLHAVSELPALINVGGAFTHPLRIRIDGRVSIMWHGRYNAAVECGGVDTQHGAARHAGVKCASTRRSEQRAYCPAAITKLACG